MAKERPQRGRPVSAGVVGHAAYSGENDSAHRPARWARGPVSGDDESAIFAMWNGDQTPQNPFYPRIDSLAQGRERRAVQGRENGRPATKSRFQVVGEGSAKTKGIGHPPARVQSVKTTLKAAMRPRGFLPPRNGGSCLLREKKKRGSGRCIATSGVGEAEYPVRTGWPVLGRGTSSHGDRQDANPGLANSVGGTRPDNPFFLKQRRSSVMMRLTTPAPGWIGQPQMLALFQKSWGLPSLESCFPFTAPTRFHRGHENHRCTPGAL